MSIVNDANCGLREAVTAINQGSNYNGCTGTGYGTNDRINVPAGTYATSTTMNVTRSVIIDGAGMAATTIKGGAPRLPKGERPASTSRTTNLFVIFQEMTVSPNSLAASSIGIQGTTSATGALNLDILAARLTGFTSNAVFVSAPSPVEPFDYTRESWRGARRRCRTRRVRPNMPATAPEETVLYTTLQGHWKTSP